MCKDGGQVQIEKGKFTVVCSRSPKTSNLVMSAALNNASGQRREMRAIARKKLEPTGGLFKNGLTVNLRRA